MWSEGIHAKYVHIIHVCIGIRQNESCALLLSSTFFFSSFDVDGERLMSAGEDIVSPAAPASTIQVVLRKRPIIVGKEDSENDIVRCVESSTVTVYEQKMRLDLTPVIEPNSFEFDHVFGEDSSNEEVYKECCQPLLETVRHGGGAVVFAFGQTGSGKTFTMLGSGHHPGLYGMAVTELLTMSHGTTSLRASFFEVYGTKLYDLLNDRAELKMLQDEYKNIHVVGLTCTDVSSAEDVKALIFRGQTLRAIGTTHANDHSSRSHAVLEITLELPGQESEGRFTFVDLAGSERASDTAEMDVKTRREGAEINKSLLALKECIRSMSMRRKHVPFRASKLTQILRESFVGRCRTCVIATISPCQRHCEDTLNTLRYADRIKELKTTNPNIADASKPCANCGAPIFIGDRHVCKRVLVQCPHCRQEMEKSALEDHMVECKEVPLRCSFCNERLLRSEQAKHNRRCPKMPVKCTACGQMMPRNTLDRHMVTDCTSAKEKCRYCRLPFPRSLISSHEQSCDAMMVACEHCLQFIRKNKMETHVVQCPMNPNRGKATRRGVAAPATNAATGTPYISPLRLRSPGRSRSKQSAFSTVPSDQESPSPQRAGQSLETPPTVPVNASVPCPYSRYGCGVKVSQRNLNSHLADSVSHHLDLVTKYANRIDLQNAELRMLVVKPHALPPLEDAAEDDAAT